MRVPLLITAAVLFCVNTVLHLFLKRYKNVTKAFILPTVLFLALAVNPLLAPAVIAAAVFSWLGDVLLEKQGMKWFTAGGIAFMLSHLCYGISYLPHIDFAAVNYFIAVPVFAVYLAVCLITVGRVKKSAPAKMPPLLLLYLATNALMNIFALMLVMSSMNIPGAVIYAGAVLFFISDNCLFIECFHEKKPNLFLPVMGTYIFGELMIAAGSALL